MMSLPSMHRPLLGAALHFCTLLDDRSKSFFIFLTKHTWIVVTVLHQIFRSMQGLVIALTHASVPHQF